jgi:ABC-type branched-subunit amino acid transport system substrate-binding protein
MFTLPATDDRVAPALADAVLAERGEGPWCVVTTADRDARVAWRAVLRELAPRGAPAPALHLTLAAAATDHDRAAADVVSSGARAVLLLAGARDAARVVRALRAAGFAGAVVGGAPLGRRTFAEAAGGAAQGVAFPLLFDPEEPGASAFVRAYEARWGVAPDYLAAHAYDAVRLVADAVRAAGPNRALVRDAIAALAPWPGVCGPVSWDVTGRNQRPVSMGVWRNGRAVALARPAGAVPRESAAISRTGAGRPTRRRGCPVRPRSGRRSRASRRLGRPRRGGPSRPWPS